MEMFKKFLSYHHLPRRSSCTLVPPTMDGKWTRPQSLPCWSNKYCGYHGHDVDVVRVWVLINDASITMAERREKKWAKENLKSCSAAASGSEVMAQIAIICTLAL